MATTAVRRRSGSSGHPSARRRPNPQRRLLLVVGLLVAAFLVFFPTKRLIEQRMRMERLDARLTALTEENTRLSAEIERLSDGGELELLARERLGMVRPGERSYLFVPTPEPAPAPDAALREPSVWTKVWRWLVGVVRGGG